MEVVSQHEADRARREAIEKNKKGDYAGARDRLAGAAQAMQSYASASPVVQQELKELHQFQVQMPMAAPMAPAMSKEDYYKQQSRSRAQKDYRDSKEPKEPKEPKESKEPKEPKSQRKFKFPWQADKDEQS